MADKIVLKCGRCNGDGVVQVMGISGGVAVINSQYDCPDCSASGYIESGHNENIDLNEKLDAMDIKLNKISSNLDDIMVKLDV